jgi:hypothetical protein
MKYFYLDRTGSLPEPAPAQELQGDKTGPLPTQGGAGKTCMMKPFTSLPNREEAIIMPTFFAETIF